MRKLSKGLAIILTIVMMLSLVANAADAVQIPSDVYKAPAATTTTATPAKGEAQKYTSAIEALYNLGLTKGMYLDDGSIVYGYGTDLTRAQFATFVMRALNVGKDAALPLLADLHEDAMAWIEAECERVGVEPFIDLDPTDAMASYVMAMLSFTNTASFVALSGQTGSVLIKGMDDGYHPNDAIEAIDAVTILVRLLGYEHEANVSGGYPIGHKVVAEKYGLLKGIDTNSFAKGVTLKREELAQLFINAIDTPIGRVSTVSNLVTEQTAETLLSTYMGYYKLVAAVESVSEVAVNATGANIAGSQSFARVEILKQPKNVAANDAVWGVGKAIQLVQRDNSAYAVNIADFKGRTLNLYVKKDVVQGNAGRQWVFDGQALENEDRVQIAISNITNIQYNATQRAYAVTATAEGQTTAKTYLFKSEYSDGQNNGAAGRVFINGVEIINTANNTVNTNYYSTWNNISLADRDAIVKLWAANATDSSKNPTITYGGNTYTLKNFGTFSKFDGTPAELLASFRLYSNFSYNPVKELFQRFQDRKGDESTVGNIGLDYGYVTLHKTLTESPDYEYDRMYVENYQVGLVTSIERENALTNQNAATKIKVDNIQNISNVIYPTVEAAANEAEITIPADKKVYQVNHTQKAADKVELPIVTYNTLTNNLQVGDIILVKQDRWSATTGNLGKDNTVLHLSASDAANFDLIKYNYQVSGIIRNQTTSAGTTNGLYGDANKRKVYVDRVVGAATADNQYFLYDDKAVSGNVEDKVIAQQIAAAAISGKAQTLNFFIVPGRTAPKLVGINVPFENVYGDWQYGKIVGTARDMFGTATGAVRIQTLDKKDGQIKNIDYDTTINWQSAIGSFNVGDNVAFKTGIDNKVITQLVNLNNPSLATITGVQAIKVSGSAANNTSSANVAYLQNVGGSFAARSYMADLTLANNTLVNGSWFTLKGYYGGTAGAASSWASNWTNESATKGVHIIHAPRTFVMDANTTIIAYEAGAKVDYDNTGNYDKHQVIQPKNYWTNIWTTSNFSNESGWLKPLVATTLSTTPKWTTETSVITDTNGNNPNRNSFTAYVKDGKVVAIFEDAYCIGLESFNPVRAAGWDRLFYTVDERIQQAKDGENKYGTTTKVGPVSEKTSIDFTETTPTLITTNTATSANTTLAAGKVVTVANGATFTLSHTVINNGTINLEAGTTLVLDTLDKIAATSTGTIVAPAGSTVKIDNDVLVGAGGLVNVSNGTVVLSSNGAGVNVTINGNASTKAGLDLYSQDKIIVNSGILTIGDGITARGEVVINRNGTVDFTGASSGDAESGFRLTLEFGAKVKGLNRIGSMTPDANGYITVDQTLVGTWTSDGSGNWTRQ